MQSNTTKTITTVAAVGVRTPRDAGEEYLALHITSVESLTGSVGRSQLSRRMVTQDLLRGRTTSAARIGEAFADAALHGADVVQIGAIAQRISGWFRGLVMSAHLSLVECWERETREQVEADLAQRRAMSSNDPSILARAILETDEHLAAAQLLRDTLAERHASLTFRCA